MGKRKTPSTLTDAEDIFCHEYIKDLNACQAAIRAGYKKSPNSNSIASSLMERPLVRARIDGLIEERKQKCKFDAQRVLDEIAAVAFADINTYVGIETEQRTRTTKGKNGRGPETTETYDVEVVRLRPWHELDTRAIGSVKETAEGIAFKMNDKIKALELLGDHLNLFKKGEQADVMALLMERFKMDATSGKPKAPDAAPARPGKN